MGEERRSINIIGYDKKPIKNTLTTMGKTDKIAIIFPGIGYTCQMPLLYYPTIALLQNGYDVLWVEYNYNSPKFEAFSDEEQFDWLNFDADAAYKAVMSEGKYKHTLLVGKSLGSFALTHINSTKKIEKTVWLTPILGMAKTIKFDLFSDMKEVCKGGLFFIGTKDRHYIKASIDELKKLGAKFVIIEDADHSMEIDGNPFKSLKALEQVLKEINLFVG